MSPHLQGPVFLQEPPPWLEFSNSTGTILSCSAHGSPPPDIRWLDASDKELTHVPRLRELLGNGSLYFPPFPPEDYSPELHAATYRCRATNPVGSIVSRDCRLRAGSIQLSEVKPQATGDATRRDASPTKVDQWKEHIEEAEKGDSREGNREMDKSEESPKLGEEELRCGKGGCNLGNPKDCFCEDSSTVNRRAL